MSVAELVVRSTAAFEHPRYDGEAVAPRARHREKSQVLRLLGQGRVLSVVAGALALTGGVSAAMSLQVEHAPGPVWPPVGLEPPGVAATPSPVGGTGQASKPGSVTPPAYSAGIFPVAVIEPEPAEKSTGRAVRAVDRPVPGGSRALPAGSGQATGGRHAKPVRVAPVRHDIPDAPAWSHGRSGSPERRAVPVRSEHRDQDARGHHGRHSHGHNYSLGGGGRHRR